MLWRSVDSSLACVSLQRKEKRENGPKGIDFAQSCWYQDSAGCLQTFLLYSGQPGLSSRMLVTTDYVLCVCVCTCSKELASFSKVPFSRCQEKNHVAVSDYAGKKTFLCSAEPEVAVMSQRPISHGCLWLVLYLLLECSICTAAFYSRKWATCWVQLWRGPDPWPIPQPASRVWLPVSSHQLLVINRDPCLELHPTQAFFGSTGVLFM